MDFNFHYFAVKTIATFAGFDEDQSQILAAYSQFVDDYDVWRNYSFQEVPDYATSLVKEKVNNRYIFYSVTTGFNSLLDSARLLLPKYQKEVVVPFHFIPTKPLSDLGTHCDRSEYRTAPADMNGTFLIKHLLDDAKRKYLDDPGVYSLMRIGVLLHIFADTYAHQNFSGFQGWENYSYLERVTDNFSNDKDITKNYNPDFLKRIFSLGHAEVGHAPDETYVSFSVSMAGNVNQKNEKEYSVHFSRSNTQVFADAAKQIFRYLYMCCKGEEPTESQWEELCRVLINGFAFKEKSISDLVSRWTDVYKGCRYHYNKNDLWENTLIKEKGVVYEVQEASETLTRNGEAMDKNELSVLIYKSAKDEFFYYNLIAKEIREKIIGY